MDWYRLSGLRSYLLGLCDTVSLDRTCIHFYTSFIFRAAIPFPFRENTDKAIIFHIVSYRRTPKTLMKGCIRPIRDSYYIGDLVSTLFETS